MNVSLPRTSAPASRALAKIGVQTLHDLSRFTEAELLALHGMGPKAMAILRGAMRENGINFREETP